MDLDLILEALNELSVLLRDEVVTAMPFTTFCTEMKPEVMFKVPLYLGAKATELADFIRCLAEDDSLRQESAQFSQEVLFHTRKLQKYHEASAHMLAQIQEDKDEEGVLDMVTSISSDYYLSYAFFTGDCAERVDRIFKHVPRSAIAYIQRFALHMWAMMDTAWSKYHEDFFTQWIEWRYFVDGSEEAILTWAREHSFQDLGEPGVAHEVFMDGSPVDPMLLQSALYYVRAVDSTSANQFNLQLRMAFNLPFKH